jgi:uncharacterized metal-binding protein
MKMPKLPQKKVGIVACSGEELAEGTVTRLAALKVLEELRPEDTVTICLPLFLAGGEGDRAFARFYPTIAVDGCDLKCAARATEEYSSKPAASVVVTDVVKACAIGEVKGMRRLNEAGKQAVDETAAQVAGLVDELLGKRWSRREGRFVESESIELAVASPKMATCACGSGIPVQTILIDGESVTLVALPVIFEQLRNAGKPPCAETTSELLEQVSIYNPVPPEAEPLYREAVEREYALYCSEEMVAG